MSNEQTSADTVTISKTTKDTCIEYLSIARDDDQCTIGEMGTIEAALDDLRRDGEGQQSVTDGVEAEAWNIVASINRDAALGERR